MTFSVISQCNIDGAKVMTVSLLIWTTTPWSLVANKAICFREDAEYSIVDTGNAGCRLYAACCIVATEMLSRYSTNYTGWFIWSDSWGLVDFDFGRFTYCLVLLGQMGNWQNWQSRLTRWRSLTGQS